MIRVDHDGIKLLSHLKAAHCILHACTAPTCAPRYIATGNGLAGRLQFRAMHRCHATAFGALHSRILNSEQKAHLQAQRMSSAHCRQPEGLFERQRPPGSCAVY